MTLDSYFDLSQSDISFCLRSSKVLFYFSFLFFGIEINSSSRVNSGGIFTYVMEVWTLYIRDFI